MYRREKIRKRRKRIKKMSSQPRKEEKTTL